VSMQGKIWAQVIRPILTMGPSDEANILCIKTTDQLGYKGKQNVCPRVKIMCRRI
jgi:hypothetical protein